MGLTHKVAGGILILAAVAVASLALVVSHDSPCGPAPALPDGAKLMKAVVHRCYGPADVLKLEDIEKPTAADNEVLVKVRAAAVNPLDWHYMRGAPYLVRMESGLGAPNNPQLGVDFAGTVESVGKNVTRFRPGDEVFGGRTGAFSEYVRVREDRALVRKPPNLTFEQAASVTHRRSHRAAGSSRQGTDSARAEGPDQRRVGRCRHLRCADRQVVRRRCDGRVQYEERGDGPVDRRRSRH